MKTLATAILASLACALPLAAGDAPAVSGDYVEARSNEVYTCGCLYSGQMTTAGREAILAWRITSGVYQGTSLAGVKVAAVIVGDANLGAYAAPRFISMTAPLTPNYRPSSLCGGASILKPWARSPLCIGLPSASRNLATASV